MAHVTSKLPWCDIDIDTSRGTVFLQQKWKYNWLLGSGVTAWTATEKKSFHNRADKYIWNSWSNRVTLKVNGGSSFAGRFRTGGLILNLDIRWVTLGEHWKVNVTKLTPGVFQRSNVHWNTRIINLDTNDFNVRTNCIGTPSVCHRQTPVTHEFGHAAGNTVVLGRGDEYPASSPHSGDHASIMNIGSQLRQRHFRTIIDELNKMIPGTTFSVQSIR